MSWWSPSSFVHKVAVYICISFLVSPGPDDCEFDVEGMCFWTNDKTNNARYQWERIDGETPSGSTGPTGDHTSKTGNDYNDI